MAVRRDSRRFGPGPFLLGLVNRGGGEGFPYDLPVIEEIDRLRLDAPVTLLAGDNGSGKSTVTELVAAAIGFGEQGGELERSGELPAVPRGVVFSRQRFQAPRPQERAHAAGLIEPVLSATKPRNGYFLRAESFFNIAAFTDSGAPFAPDLSLYGDTPLHQQSHGESFLALAANRFGGESLFVLDEPEAALSLTGLLALLAIVVRASRAGGQFVIATHSPILLACPDARIYELDRELGATETGYDELEAVRLTRAFLNAPDRYLRATLADLDEA